MFNGIIEFSSTASKWIQVWSLFVVMKTLAKVSSVSQRKPKSNLNHSMFLNIIGWMSLSAIGKHVAEFCSVLLLVSSFLAMFRDCFLSGVVSPSYLQSQKCTHR